MTTILGFQGTHERTLARTRVDRTNQQPYPIAELRNWPCTMYPRRLNTTAQGSSHLQVGLGQGRWANCLGRYGTWACENQIAKRRTRNMSLGGVPSDWCLGSSPRRASAAGEIGRLPLNGPCPRSAPIPWRSSRGVASLSCITLYILACVSNAGRCLPGVVPQPGCWSSSKNLCPLSMPLCLQYSRDSSMMT